MVGHQPLELSIVVRIHAGQQMKIRNYRSSDYSEVVAILKDSKLFDEVWDSEDNLKSMVVENPKFILVAEDQGKVIGNIFIVNYGKKVSYFFRLAVKKEFRKQGVATALIKKAEETVKEEGSKELGFYVDSGNLDLYEFYKKRGFKISQKMYYYMWKEL
jgi:ribosomal protein S18 acetylase RimI-like enzyme